MTLVAQITAICMFRVQLDDFEFWPFRVSRIPDPHTLSLWEAGHSGQDDTPGRPPKDAVSSPIG